MNGTDLARHVRAVRADLPMIMFSTSVAVHGPEAFLAQGFQAALPKPASIVDLRAAVREALSPRFVPDEIFQVAEIPRTLSGKKQELPIKKLMLGQPVEKVLNRDAMANPQCLTWYIEMAQRHLQKHPA